MDELSGGGKLCRGTRLDGAVCQATALVGSDFCFFHDPARAAERREAQALGGRQNRMRVLTEITPDFEIQDSEDVVALVSETINQVRKGKIDPRVANAVGYLANVLVKVFESQKLSTRVDKLEAVLRNRTGGDDLELTGT